MTNTPVRKCFKAHPVFQMLIFFTKILFSFHFSARIYVNFQSQKRLSYWLDPKNSQLGKSFKPRKIPIATVSKMDHGPLR